MYLYQSILTTLVLGFKRFYPTSFNRVKKIAKLPSSYKRPKFFNHKRIACFIFPFGFFVFPLDQIGSD
jgi:hypothetical protein